MSEAYRWEGSESRWEGGECQEHVGGRVVSVGVRVERMVGEGSGPASQSAPAGPRGPAGRARQRVQRLDAPENINSDNDWKYCLFPLGFKLFFFSFNNFFHTRTASYIHVIASCTTKTDCFDFHDILHGVRNPPL